MGSTPWNERRAETMRQASTDSGSVTDIDMKS
jgi:hypothetical protein